MKKGKCLFLITTLLVSGMVSSCSCSNNNNNTSIYSEAYNDERVVFTYHEDTSSYSVKMNQEYKNTTEEIVIPSTYYEYPVTEIERDAFKNFTYLSKITIPSSITKIGYNAFGGCYSLESLTLPFAGESNSSNTYLGYLFGETSYSTYSLIPESIKNITITNTTFIGEGAFYGFEKVESVTLPNGVTSIGNYAFYDCKGLQDIIIPSSITKIGYQAFYLCDSLNKNIYNNGIYLGNANNKYIVLLDVTSSATEITTHNDCRIVSIYSDLSKIKTISIMENVKDIYIESSNGWNNLTNVVVSSKNSEFDSRENCNAIINSKTNELVLACCNTLLLDSVTSISSLAYQGKILSGSKCITIPKNVTSIGEGAFKNCTGISIIEFNNLIKDIPSSVCEGCTSLKQAKFPKVVRTIGQDAFKDTRINTLYFGCSQEQYDNDYITMDEDTKTKWSNINKTFDYERVD